ncbi:MAG TPA: electron transport complex subunit RsxC [bacterium]|nr:electron transport complex subunit RsxC [bacterium]
MDEKQVVDYTKYRLKPESEIIKMLKEVSQLQVLLCEKCYKKFEEDFEPECLELREIISRSGTTLLKCTSIPFLCNNYLTGNILERIRNDNCTVGVVSCGIGIQYVAGVIKGGKKVLALADTVSQSGNATSISGYHGIALGEEKCAACGQCWLEITGGICPVINCAKSLLNGPCGGADKNGMCEVNPEKKCAWIEIFERLEKSKRKISGSIKTINHDIFGPYEREKISLLSRERRKEGFYGGVHPEERKEDTAGLAIAVFPAPEKVCLFLSQHAGLPAKPLVRAGDFVKAGQKIAESSGFISAPVHSSVSGKVLSVTEQVHPVTGQLSPAVIIENDGRDERDFSVEPLAGWESLEPLKLLDYIREKGIVGMGGAMFPSAVKLFPPRPVDTLLINGCECEPCLNGDNRLMVEHPVEIIKGAEVAKKLLCAGKILFCIEENKKEAVEALRSSMQISTDMNVVELKTKYPQGAEKMLIKRVLERSVPDGKLPFDVGAVVLNVGTAYAICRAVCEGMPLFERIVTVSGDVVTRRGNFLMKIGTPFSHIAGKCLASGADIGKHDIKMGGPMMGILQKNTDSAVIKGTTGILFLEKSPVEVSESRDCIKCGRCVDVCPMELYPHYYAYYGKKGLWGKCVEYGVNKCIECGCCQYICSSKIDLVGYIKKAKRYADNQA